MKSTIQAKPQQRMAKVPQFVFNTTKVTAEINANGTCTKA